MKITFRGVRGSIPTPLTPGQIKSKISSVLAQAKPEDLRNEDSREKFLANLSPTVFSTVGGNTACIEIRDDSTEDVVLFDAGTGIRQAGLDIMALKRPAARCHVFFSHFHWDHIQGLPFFSPAFDPANFITFYAIVSGFEGILRSQMQPPFFPVTMDMMRANKDFHLLGGESIIVGDMEINYRKMNHPGGCLAYSVKTHGGKVVYSTDTELSDADFARTPENSAFFGGTDLLILDAQYTLGEAIEKFNWGHSSYSLASDFAATWNIPRLALFHHEPLYDDRKIAAIENSSRWYADHLDRQDVDVFIASEGMEVLL